MPRPHEDLQKHTLVDHKSGGSLVSFPAGAWCAIDVSNVTAARVDAGLSSYETLIEKARTSAAKAGKAAILRSDNNRRVIVLLQINGHDAFRHLSAAWDDHHLKAERHAVAESRSLVLYRLTASAGDVFLDPDTKDAYAYEHLARDVESVRNLAGPVASAQGFRGVSIFGTDDASASVILYRFEHAADIVTFRETQAAEGILGASGSGGDAFQPVRVVKTFD